MSTRPTSKRGASKAHKSENSNVALSKLPGWMWLVTGVAAGFFVAFLFRLSPGTVDVREVAGQNTAPESSNTPSPVFDFYTLLPESEVMLSESESKQELKPQPGGSASKKVTQSQSSSVYLLQAGSFRSQKDADRLRAQLLLWGLSPKVEKVNVGSNEFWHRVQLGPFENKTTLTNAQKVLAEHNVDSLLLKVR